MEKFEYLPQLIVAYDGDINDETANLIHISKAVQDNNYYCPCCGGEVNPRALDSKKVQSHYYHLTGECTRESQVHWFCKNWLFEKGSKFYIQDVLYEVDSIDIEKPYSTPFGGYRPDITVRTKNGATIFFELFFANRKKESDYFCKWQYLENDVIEVNLNEFLAKESKDFIPHFTYLYHDGKCYCKEYVERDLYANTIAKRKAQLTRQELNNYKARIEQLDWFWQMISSNVGKDEILDAVVNMDYDDQVFCYDLVKRKHCVKYLKDDIRDIINEQVLYYIRKQIDLPDTGDIFVDLVKRSTRTYEMVVRVKYQTELFSFNENTVIGMHYYNFTYDNEYWKKLSRFPKIVFNKSIFEKIDLLPEDIKKVKETYNYAVKKKEKILQFEKELSSFKYSEYYVSGNAIKVKIDDNIYEVEHNLSVDNIYHEINKIQELEKAKKDYEQYIASDNYKEDIDKIRLSFPEMDLNISSCFSYDKPQYRIKSCRATLGTYSSLHVKEIMEDINWEWSIYKDAYDIVYKINNCSNHLWRAYIQDISIFHYEYGKKIMIEFIPYKEKDGFKIKDHLDYKKAAEAVMNRIIRNVELTKHVRIVQEVQ